MNAERHIVALALEPDFGRGVGLLLLAELDLLNVGRDRLLELGPACLIRSCRGDRDARSSVSTGTSSSVVSRGTCP